MAKETYRIIGVIVNRESGEGVGGLRVEAWDHDNLVDDLVGQALTGPDGAFLITFDSDYFQELFFDKEPDLYFRVFDSKGELLVKTPVRRNIGSDESFRILVPAPE